MSGYRSKAARDLVSAVRKAGGEVERASKGRLKITGPSGTVTIQEPADESRKLITERTGLSLGEDT